MYSYLNIIFSALIGLNNMNASSKKENLGIIIPCKGL